MEDSLSVTRTTYRVSDFLSWQRQGTLELRPPFQRESVWRPKAKSFFIDTLVRGFPVPLIFLQDVTNRTTFEPMRLVVDGQQRLRTVLGYIDADSLRDFNPSDDFAILEMHNKEIANRAFNQLHQEIQDRILQFQFSVHVLPSATPQSLLLETFARMNATGTKANPQELRNAKYSGAFKQLAYRLSYDELDRWLRWGLFTKPQIARMREVELTSELLLFLTDGFAGKSQKAIGSAYRRYDDGVPESEYLVRRFVHILKCIDAIYGTDREKSHGDQFRNSPFNTQGWIYPLFCLLHDLSFATTVPESPRTRPKTVDAAKFQKHLASRAKALRAGKINEDLLKALRGASTDKSSRQARYDFLRKNLRDV